jgi:hypothetical protein
MSVTRLLPLLAFLALPALGQIVPNTAAYEPMLIPVFANGPGANGSQWTSSLTMLSGKTADVTLPRAYFSGDPRCPAVCGCGATPTLRQDEPAEVCPSLADASGLIVFIPRPADAEDDQALNAHLRVRDTSRSDQNAGTEVPVVRERDLRDSDPFWLLGVDSDAHFRVVLRFYDVTAFDGLPVTVNVFDAHGLELLSTTVTLSNPIRTVLPDFFPLRPSFAMIGDLTGQFPQLRDKGPLNIRLQFAESLADPPYPHKKNWAMASITNNTTQLFTTVTPH